MLGAWQRHAGDRALRIMDVGSGGGLPGVVIAIAAPQHHVTCVDTGGQEDAFFIRQGGRRPGPSRWQPNMHGEKPAGPPCRLL